MNIHSHPFIIRVYGLCIHRGKLLVCDEFWFDTPMTKFPGGGMEFGEGTLDCLRRECREELGQEPVEASHFYTTDFFQPTRFLPGRQLISIYYRMGLELPGSIPAKELPFDFEQRREGALACRWIDMELLEEDHLTLPIDRKVAGMLKTGWAGR